MEDSSTSAANTDYFTKVGNPGTATSLDAPGHSIGGTGLTVISTTNWPTTTGVIFAMDTVSLVNGVEVRDAGSYTEWEGVVTDSTTISNITIRLGTDRDYASGSTTRVYIPVASSKENRLVDGLVVSHNQDGTMKTALPLTSPVLTTPKVVTSINDSNGNEVIKTPATASAVNELTVNNSVTGSPVVLEATGGDTNIHVVLRGKGNGLTKTSVLRQDNTTNSYKHNTVELTGYGYIAGTNGTFLAEAITFGVEFAQIPIITVSLAGASSGTSPGGVGIGAATIEHYSDTTTGTNVRMGKFAISGFDAATTFAIGTNYFYTWRAIGELA